MDLVFALYVVMIYSDVSFDLRWCYTNPMSILLKKHNNKHFIACYREDHTDKINVIVDQIFS
jgi:hypothetical protein